ncbi:MAG: N,N-dimethylformamidase beta subunit family domain-containing protein [Pseudomonadota bacterium]
MLPLTGYTDRLSARPGERVAVHVSAREPGPAEARLVRLISGDPNPAGPGRIEEDRGDLFTHRFEALSRLAHPGSFAVIAAGPQFEGAFSLEAVIWPTRPGEGEQIALSAFDPEMGAGVALGLDVHGCAMALVGRTGEAPLRLATDRPLATRHWVRLRASVDPASGTVTVASAPVAPLLGSEQAAIAESRLKPGPIPLAETWHIAALGPGADGAMAGLFNGKIEAPAIQQGAGPEDPGAAHPGTVLAAWDFALGMQTLTVHDTGPRGLAGRLVNLPARAMTGARWTGREMCWRHAPDQYAAIHFHDSDIADCGWPADFAFTLPEDLPSGIWGIRLSSGEAVDTLPLFVPPPRGRATADLCVLMSTFTYVVYGNFDRPDFDEGYRARAAALGMSPEFPGDHKEYGLSTYNSHSDGSGICHASHLRPMMTLRPGFMNQNDPHGSGLRHFAADTHLIAWLEAKGIAYDIVTDHDLDAEGVKLLAPYRSVLTCSHPEYHTAETLDALTAYRNGGGRLCYLGGNGFYWRVARHGEMREAIEIRRGEGGIRAWASEPGEYFNAFDGAYGGLWRRQGRAPQAMAGVGFSAQGTFEGSHYRLTEAARDPRAAWIFEGVAEPGDLLGGFGLSGGGAAGFELDRADTRLGTPEHALILARSEGHSERFVLVHEEQLTHLKTLPGEPAADLIRAEITFYETPAGGAVFATGSITFCGSLPVDGCDNPVSAMLERVVRRFLDPAPFAPPE